MPTSDHTRAAGVRQAHDVSRDDVGEARNRGFEQRLERWRTARFRDRQLRQNYASKFLMLQRFTSYVKGWRMAHHNVTLILFSVASDIELTHRLNRLFEWQRLPCVASMPAENA